MEKYRIFIIDTDYEMFIESIYEKYPGLENKSFVSQYKSHADECFSIVNFYSENLKKLGRETMDIIYNHKYMQEQWARENNRLLNGCFTIYLIIYVYRGGVNIFLNFL